MTIMYDVILKRHPGASSQDVCVFYDEDRDKAIDEMGKYCKKNGFTIYEKDGRFTIADIILREREATGKVISEIPYCKLFNTRTGKRME